MGFALRAAEPTSEERAFKAAADDFDARFWAQAEADFTDFVKKYPASIKLPEAYMCAAIARFHQTNYAGALELLLNHQAQAGKRADDYLFWQAKTLQAKGDSVAAAEAFGKLTREFPTSVLCLGAAVEEARTHATLREWPRVIELLQKPDGVFQAAVRTNSASEAIVSGWLLLGEAQFARQDYAAAEAAVQPLTRLVEDSKRLSPGAAWQWHYLLARIRVAQGQPEAALDSGSNLLAAAAGTADPGQQAESYAFVGDLLERLGRAEEAINLYTNNLAAGIPVEPQDLALRRVTDLLVRSNKVAQAALRLEDFVARLPDAPSVPLALLILGELRLRQHVTEPAATRIAPAGTNAPAATNYLEKAIATLTQITQMTNKSPPVSCLGRAELDLGWCYWWQEKWDLCQQACLAAVRLLPPSSDQATARFKLADALFKQKQYGDAITQYYAITNYNGFPQVRSNLFEPALYQAARAGLASGDLPATTNALAKILAWYPNGYHTHSAELMAGQALSRSGDPNGARQIFEEAVHRAPDSNVAPLFVFAVARTFEREDKLSDAIATYRHWIEQFPTHSARPQAEYYLALDYFLAGNATNALTLMARLKDPANPFTPLAQWWLADYYYRSGTNYLQAEMVYQEIYKNTNLPPSELTYQAQMMAGRAAMRRQGVPEAINHFTDLTSDLKCPPEIRFEALFAYSDALQSQESTNKAQDYAKAISILGLVLTEIKQTQTTNRLAAAALGAQGNCYLQLAQQKGQLDQLTNAAQAFQDAIAFPGADVRTRCMAQVGWGSVIEKQARQKTDPERTALLNLALEKYRAVFFANNLAAGEQADLFWVKKAALETARLTEELGLWSSAVAVYKRLGEVLPPLRPSLENKINAAHAHERPGGP